MQYQCAVAQRLKIAVSLKPSSTYGSSSTKMVTAGSGYNNDSLDNSLMVSMSFLRSVPTFEWAQTQGEL